MSILIRQNDNIKGINVGAHEMLLAQFADDTSLCLDGSEKSFRECIKLLQFFSRISGLHINSEKTNVIWIGSMRNSDVRFLRDENFCWNPGIFRCLGIKFCTDLHRICEVNFDGKIEEIKRVLCFWKKRQLTPFGKITVLKTLIISRCTYLFLNLPDPPDSVISELQKIMYNYLWNDKTPKIKRTVVCKPYAEGGLQMVDLNAYISSLKISWLKRLKGEGDFQHFLLGMFPFFKDLLTRGQEYVKVCLQQCTNRFWLDVLKHFRKLGAKIQPQNMSEFMAECIHCNTHIIRNKRTVCVDEWLQNDILFIRDLYDIDNNRFLSFNEFKERYPNITKTNYLLYAGIVKAIEEFKKSASIQICSRFRIVDSNIWTVILKGGRFIRTILLKSDVRPTAVAKWEECFNNLQWSEIFKRCVSSKNVQLNWFQTRVVHRLLPTRKYLYDCKIVEDPTCTLCKQQTQSIRHLLWKCSKTQLFWTDFILTVRGKCLHCNELNLTEELILFGCQSSVHTDEVFDFLLVLAKYYIYCSYLKETLPKMQTFIEVLKQRYTELKTIAVIEGQITRFEDKWMLYQELV